MAGAIQLTEVDFKQIKDNLVNYLKSTDKFTDYDFEGSNLSVILNLIAYQAQLNAYTTNMVANESFLSSATLRDNVVANARQIGYTPTSAKSAMSLITFEFDLGSNGDLADLYPNGLPQYLELRPGPTFTTSSAQNSFQFNIIDTQTAAVNADGVCTFENIPIYEGFTMSESFTFDSDDYHQRFVLDNSNIDTSTIRVEIQEDPNETSTFFYKQANNLTTLTAESRTYWIEEVQQEKYELTFGDGYFGKSLADGAIIHVTYVVSNGEVANGIRGENVFVFRGSVFDYFGGAVSDKPTVTNVSTSNGGSSIESVPSVKFRAPKSYSAQNRCVTPTDYETIIRTIYPGIDDMYVYGGETLEIPEYGRVYVVIKPTSGEYLSNSTKNYIKKSLEPFRIASLDIVMEDPEILYVEAESTVYYDEQTTTKDSTAIIADVKSTLTDFSNSDIVARFGGSVRYSRIVGAIDDADDSITRNNTILRMRKNMVALENTAATYEVCFNNPLRIDNTRSVIYSTGFMFPNDDTVYYFKNEPQSLDSDQGRIYLFYFDEFNDEVIVNKDFGTIDYTKGEILIGFQKSVTISSTTLANNIIEVRSYPLEMGQDINGKGTIYLSFDVSKSTIAALVDTDTSGS